MRFIHILAILNNHIFAKFMYVNKSSIFHSDPQLLKDFNLGKNLLTTVNVILNNLIRIPNNS